MEHLYKYNDLLLLLGLLHLSPSSFLRQPLWSVLLLLLALCVRVAMSRRSGTYITECMHGGGLAKCAEQKRPRRSSVVSSSPSTSPPPFCCQWPAPVEGKQNEQGIEWGAAARRESKGALLFSSFSSVILHSYERAAAETNSRITIIINVRLARWPPKGGGRRRKRRERRKRGTKSPQRRRDRPCYFSP